MRNELWAQRIEAHAAERRTGLMYVLGAAHLLDFEAYDGLLTLLAQPAFQVRRVRQAEDIGQHTHVCRTEFSPVWGVTGLLDLEIFELLRISLPLLDSRIKLAR
jgi:hypothetical protein